MSAEPPSPPARKGHFEEDDDAVPTIPELRLKGDGLWWTMLDVDLEEEAEEDITRQVAAPPVAAPSLAPPVRTVRELEGALNSRGTLPASPEEGVDLAPLMQCLCSDRQVFEQDSTWDHELIFQEVASAINQDMLGDGEGIESEEMDNMQR
ncbi:Intraflagellar transport protein 43 [Durusdinium trenchii]|uniref:Intraflagellar transport protein 43 n=3 Tax=Durusdinium trenchii TaxID=1381693 RepID=A0ABP0N8U3_9DINO